MCHTLKLSDRARTILACQKEDALWQDWQWQLAHTLTAADFHAPEIDAFPMRVTPYYASLADFDNPADPILRQFLATEAELLPDDFSADPFGETAHAARAPGVKQRYPDRLLAMMNITCSTYCRHCTRRGLLEQAQRARLEEVIEIVKTTPTIREVLLSGGDPLILPDEEVLAWVGALAALDQLDAVRLCTRTPVVLPMRFYDHSGATFVKRLAEVGQGKVWLQTQFNHPNEFTAASERAVAVLNNHGIPVSNQSVLLRGINDDPAVMTHLCAGLQRRRVRPYYLFACDPIKGIQHFRTSLDAARTMREHLLNHLGGLACPRVVADLPEATHKTDV